MARAESGEFQVPVLGWELAVVVYCLEPEQTAACLPQRPPGPPSDKYQVSGRRTRRPRPRPSSSSRPGDPRAARPGFLKPTSLFESAVCRFPPGMGCLGQSPPRPPGRGWLVARGEPALQLGGGGGARQDGRRAGGAARPPSTGSYGDPTPAARGRWERKLHCRLTPLVLASAPTSSGHVSCPR